MISGSLLTYSQFLCAALCSALSASLVGVAKSVLQTIIGFFTFGGVRFHPLNVLGLLLNTLGGCLYSYVKFAESREKKWKDMDGIRGGDDEEGKSHNSANVPLLSVLVEGGNNKDDDSLRHRSDEA